MAVAEPRKRPTPMAPPIAIIWICRDLRPRCRSSVSGSPISAGLVAALDVTKVSCERSGGHGGDRAVRRCGDRPTAAEREEQKGTRRNGRELELHEHAERLDALDAVCLADRRAGELAVDRVHAGKPVSYT